MADKKLNDQSLSEIDRALAAAANRKANRVASGDATARPTATAEAKPARPKLTEEEKAAKNAARDAERAERKAKRDAERAEKKAAMLAARSPAHMKKVMKAASKLAPLEQAALLLFNEAVTNLPAADLAALALHIQHHNRVKDTERAINQKITEGMQVTVVSGDPRYIGKTGVVAKAQRIRCYVTIEGFSKPAYLFTSNVAPVETTEEKQTEDATAIEATG